MNDAVASICPQEVLLDLDVRSRWEALRAVSAAVGRACGLNPEPILRSLWRREQAASTALGAGFAVPHARIPGIAQPVAIYARTRTPIDFAAPDHRPVSELFVLFVPDQADNDQHLQLLALIAEVFSEKTFRAQLSGTSDPTSIQSIFKRWTGQRDLRGGIAIAA